MALWRRPAGGRHARGQVHAAARPARSDTFAVPVVEPAHIAPPAAEAEPRGLVRLVFEDGSAVALDAHDPRSRAFRAVADSLLAPRAAATAQARGPDADPQQVTDIGGAAAEGGLR
jgi:hypothetical protein